MVFHPPRATGLDFGLAALLVLLAVDAALLAVLRANPLAPAGFLSLLLLVASLPAVAWLAYRLYGLLRSRYVLSLSRPRPAGWDHPGCYRCRTARRAHSRPSGAAD